ncbi:uncharacterized protein LOC581572 [Strongylocentrotus purpuratus]|uniref:DNA-directed primase/polymerase protein n=1 Tax=Strongylocentrotus purpuratus TaxID=7668 RepID=A0A7M7RDG6_STRPU|nr:uncharacterized protein LOC581572 [Strongylocentrotus purpuratus]XP_786654.3 uncharacterized protein LOC581572 [Strongylocentrotus purpuratus]|eukprot:XP_786654.3 PREDICTED: uncharacterized protein LOC581572 [Strongylocentrotus purpuratus]
MSNNIMILVDLRRGVYYQKCHDPTCRAQGYKSDDHPVPPEHLPSFTDWDEDELINVSLRVEEDARSNEMNQNSFCSDFDSFHDDDADEELIKLGERYDAPETGNDGKTVHRTVNLVQLIPSPTFKSSISPSGIRMDVPVISESRSDASFRNFTSWVSWADVAPPLVKSRACSNVSERCLNVDGAHSSEETWALCISTVTSGLLKKDRSDMPLVYFG